MLGSRFSYIVLEYGPKNYLVILAKQKKNNCRSYNKFRQTHDISSENMKVPVIILVFLLKNTKCDFSSVGNKDHEELPERLMVESVFSGLPSQIIMVYEDAVARIPCLLSTKNDENLKLFWMFSKVFVIVIQDRSEFV